MAIIRLTDDNFERFKLVANPLRQFSSASSGITGSVPLFSDASSGVKDLEPTYGEAETSVSIDQIDLYRNDLVQQASILNTGNGADISAGISNYLTLVNSAPTPVRSSKRQEIIRFTPGVTLEENYFRKQTVKEVLFPYYQYKYPTAQWAYTNYHSLNFVTGGNLPTESVLIYPAGTGSVDKEDWNPFGPANAFTFDFYINPRYTTTSPGEEYTAGTILHMSSCYAISLVTGSSIGPSGMPDRFRLLLQLSASADAPPSKCQISGDNIICLDPSITNKFMFITSDNVLTGNNWHHVAIRWGGPNVNNGQGSFVIDGVQDNSFTINSSSVMQASSSGTSLLDPDGLFVGNFYEGDNYGNNAIAKFFNPIAHRDEGVTVMNDFGAAANNDPGAFTFNHPLNAEIHDIKIYNQYRLENQIEATRLSGSDLTSDLLFYVPPFFTKDSRNRYVLQTPFFDATGSTEDPFNVALSFGVGGMSINLENFTKELVTSQFPRLLNLTASRIDTQVQIPQTANYLLYESGSNRKRNITVLPCDNGKFFPNFDLLSSTPQTGVTNILTGTQDTLTFTGSFDDRFVDAFGNTNYSLITLNKLVDTGSLVPGSVPTRSEPSGSLLTPLEGASPEDPGVSPGNILTVLQRLHDPSSNEVVFFDISNMFYGDRINPETFLIEDLQVSGSGGRMTFKVRDDGRGNLYRADALSEHAKWASVGNILYEEGIVVIKTPHMPFFGKDSFRVTFQGDRSVYVLEMLIPATTSLFNSSSNPTYKDLAPSNYASETAKKFTYLTGINLHDNNLNIIGRANLAQPIIKREEDRVVIRLRMDF